MAEDDDHVYIDEDATERRTIVRRPGVRPLAEGPWIRCPACAKPIRLWQNGDGAIDSYQHEPGAARCAWWIEPEGGQAWMRSVLDAFGRVPGDIGKAETSQNA